MDLDSVAEELYALPRADFTPTRDARVKEARSAGNRDLAAEIGKLRKPTSAAWLANLLAREEADDLRALAELGDALRDAQGSLDRDSLRQLSRQRHKVVHGLVQRARALAREAGQPVGESVTRELEETLTTALSDAGAAGELAAGRLTEKLSLTDHGGDWFAGSDRPVSRESTSRRTKPAPDKKKAEKTPEDEVRAARIDRLRRDIDAARGKATTAGGDRDRERHAADDAVARCEEADARLRDLREQLAAAEQAYSEATEVAHDARRSLDASQADLEAAQQRVDELEESLHAM